VWLLHTGGQRELTFNGLGAGSPRILVLFANVKEIHSMRKLSRKRASSRPGNEAPQTKAELEATSIKPSGTTPRDAADAPDYPSSGSSPDQAVIALVDLFLAANEEARQHSLAQLRALNDPVLTKTIVARLIVRLCGPDIQQSQQAATVLTGIGRPSFRALLVASLRSDHVPTRLRCLEVAECLAGSLPEEERVRAFLDLEYAKGLLRDPLTVWYAETLLAVKRGE
jgi:hypothetical protein